MAIRRSTRPKRTGALEALRFLCALICVLMLWQPEWRVITEPNSKPEVAILFDASRSSTTADAILPVELSASQEVVTRSEWMEKILGSDLFKPLKSDERNRVFEEGFSAPPEDADPATLALAGTDIYSAIDNILEEHNNLRAMILLTDGDWNTGIGPVAAAQKMRRRNIPLFAIPVGSDNRLPDLDISNVTAPTYGIVGENVQIPFTIVSSLDRDVRTIVRLRDIKSGKERTKNIVIPAGEEYHDSILWRLTAEGSSTLELSIPVATGEMVAKNNKRQFTIAGRKESLNVLVIESTPRWEYRFIRNALYRDPGVTVSCLLLHPQLGEGDGPGYITKFPEKLEDLQKYDVVFIGDVGIGNGGLTKEQAELLKGLVEDQASGIVFIPGRQGNEHSLVDSPLGDLIPVILDDKRKEGYSETTASQLNLTSEGKGSLLTMLGDTEDDNPVIWKSLPGFYWHAPVIKAKGGTDVLAVHANRSNEFGRIPMLVTKTAGNGKVLFLGHDSAWRWRRGVEDLYHYRFWGQVARWMSYQRNMAAGERIRLYFTPDRPKPGDTVTLNANAFDQYGAPLKEGDVLVDITSPDGKTRRISLDKAKGAWGSYTGRFKIAQPGAWKIEAVVGEDKAHGIKTTLLAQGSEIEKTGMPARPDVLEEMTRVARGRMINGEKIAALIKEIQALPDPQAMETRTPLWSSWIIAACLVLLLAIFWVGRKLNGTF
ncbi:membrane protein [Oceaniferula spumae]|uniref:Membrane protein n=1 Tax=Oceaniferula spumae TaxID=2979115 RepID=A0AAT9FHY7_9BACT